ncbi:MAG: prepilin-type N-terminal cleavage/methylation domain-containing protein [Verrucomicrobiota bacterium]
MSLRPYRKVRATGFTLVEVTLAIFVVAVGLLAAYSLFPAGLTMNKFAIDDTETALFGEEVMNGLHSKIDGDPVAWANLIDKPNAVYLEAVTYGMWEGGTVGALEMRPMSTPTQIKTNVYVQWDNRVIERAVRYNLIVGNVAGHPDIRYARLKVWNGQYGTTNSPAEFYTEFYNYRVIGP